MKIERKAEALLVDSLGNDLSKITNAINKLCEVLESSSINFDDIQKHIGVHREYNNFELQTALAMKNKQRVISIVDYFLSNSKNFRPQPIIGLLFSFFSKLLIMHSLTSQSDKVLSETINVHPYFLKEYKAGKSHYSFSQCVFIISELKSADLKFKGIQGTAKPTFLKDVILKIIS